MFFERCVNKAVERMEVKGGIRLSIREVSGIKKNTLQEGITEKKVNVCVGCYPPKPLSLANLVNLRTRFLFKGGSSVTP